MTIDNSIENLVLLKKLEDSLGSINGNTKKDMYSVVSQSLGCAIDTMRKYQKIEEIISDYEGYKWEEIEVSDIRRILDGNDDCN